MMMSTILMLFIFYLTLTVVKFASRELVQNYPHTCVFSGFVIQYSYMSALFWLNSMGYFMWTQFRKLTPVYNQGGGRWQLGIFDAKFKWHALYSWGCPLVVTIITIIIQNLPEHLTENIITPRIGVTACSLAQDLATLYYFHIINAPILVC